MSSRTPSPFDRVRPRTGTAPGVVAVDAEGKRALFSTAPPVPPRGSVTVECSACSTTAVLSAFQAARAALPSVHLPFLHGRYASFLRCPACHRRTWVRLRIRV